MTYHVFKNTILMFLMITFLCDASGQSCKNFPKIIGGNAGNTNIQQIDVFLNGDALAFAGDSSDSTIAAYTGNPVPIVGITSIQYQSYYWAKTDLSKTGFTYAVIQFSQDGKLLAVHTRGIGTALAMNFITVFNSMDGTVISSRTYSNSYISVTADARSLIIGSMPNPMVYAWVGKRNSGGTIGKQLFKFDATKQDASFSWSLECGPTVERHGVTFGRDEQFLYTTQWLRTFKPGGTAVLSMVDSNGNEKYSLDLDLAASWQSSLLQYKKFNTEDVVIFTGGIPQVQFARVLTTVSNPYTPLSNTLYDNFATIDRRLRGLFIKTKDVVNLLFYEMSSKLTFLATLTYSTQTLVYVKILPNMPTDFQTIGIFATENLFFTASKGTTQFDTLSSNQVLHATLTQSVIYSSLFDQACYQQPQNVVPDVKMLTAGTIIAAPSVFTTNYGFLMAMDTSYVVKDMNQMVFTRAPTWCPSVNSPPNFKKNVYKEVILQINEKKTIELFDKDYLRCKPRQIMLIPETVDLNNSSPAQIMSNFTDSTGIASLKGTQLKLNPTMKQQEGLRYVYIFSVDFGFSYTVQPVVVINIEFLSDPSKPIKMRVNEVKEYKLPVKKSTNQRYPIEAFHELIPQFAKFVFPDYSLTPTKQLDVGVFKVKGKIGNNELKIFKEFQFTVEVINDPPEFVGVKKELPPIIVSQKQITEYQLPMPQDQENQTITVVTKELKKDSQPSFVTFYAANLSYVLAPTLQHPTGKYSIQIELQDSFGEKKQTVYQFDITLQAYFPPPINFTGIELFFLKIQATKVSRNGMLTVNFYAVQGADQIIKRIGNESLDIRIERMNHTAINYTIMVKDTTRNTIVVLLNFTNPKDISAATVRQNSQLTCYQDLDRLQIKVKDRIEYKTKEYYAFLMEYENCSIAIPPQLSSQFEKGFANSLSGGQITVDSKMILNLFQQFLITQYSTSLIQYIWAQLDDMSFLTINILISMNVPGIVQIVQQIFMNFVYFDVFYVDQWVPPTLKKVSFNMDVPEDPINDYFQENGFEVKFLMKNIGSTLIFILLYVITWWIYLILKIFGRYFDRMKILELKLKKQLMWNGSLNLFISQFMPLIMSSFINLYDVRLYNTYKLHQIRFDDRVFAFSAILSFIFLGVSILALICITVVLSKIYKGLHIESCSILIDNLNLNKQTQQRFIVTFWNFFYLVRWILTIIILLTLRNFPQHQISSLLGLSLLFQYLTLGFKPYQDPLSTYMSLFNESMVSCYLYTLFTLTDFHVTGKNLTREQSGWALAIIVLFTVFVNLMKFLVIKFIELRAKCRLRQMRAKKGVETSDVVRKIRAEEYAEVSDMEVKEQNKPGETQEVLQIVDVDQKFESQNLDQSMQLKRRKSLKMSAIEQVTAVVEKSQYLHKQQTDGNSLHSRARRDSTVLFREMREDIKQQDKEIEDLIANIKKNNEKNKAGTGLKNENYQFEQNVITQENSHREFQMKGPLAFRTKQQQFEMQSSPAPVLQFSKFRKK